jgi:hypothetical protein
MRRSTQPTTHDLAASSRTRRARRRLALTAITALVGFTTTLAVGPASASAAAPGAIITIAGGGSDDPGDGGPATSTALINSIGVTVDGAGNVLIVDGERVRLVAAANCSSACADGLASTTRGNIYTIAGTGTQGFSGDHGPATNAELSRPSEVAIDSAGNVLIADTNNARIRMIAAADCAADCRYDLSSTVKDDIYTVAGMGTWGFAGDGTPATSAELDLPNGIAVDGAGDLMIADLDNSRVRMVAGSTCLSGCAYGLTAMTKGDIYTVAGTGSYGFGGDGGAATAAKLRDPDAVAVDAAGNVLVSDLANNDVRVIEASNCSSGCPYGLTAMNKGDIDTIAGTGSDSYSGDGGPAANAELAGAAGVSVDGAGNVLIADTRNHRVRVIAAADCPSRCDYGLASTMAGSIYTIAGNGGSGFSGDNGPATAAELSFPSDVAVDRHGNVFIADSNNARVREVAAEAWLSVNEDGTGSGQVTGPAIDCPSTCTANAFVQSVLTMTATPAPGSTFNGWTGGGCSGTGPCTTTISGNVTITATFNPTVQDTRAALAKLLKQLGVGAKFGPLLHSGGYRLTFGAPAAGKLTIGWYLVPAGAHLATAKHKHAKPTLIATGTATASQPGNVKLTVKLTRAGRTRLRHARRLKLTARATFTPAGGAAVTATATFTLKR